MAFDKDAFAADILKGVTVDDTQKQALQALLNNPEVAKKFEDATLRQSDYSTKMNEYQGRIKKAQDYWDSLVETDKRLREEKATLSARLAAEGGDLTNPDKAHTGVSREELQKLAQEAVTYNNAVTKLAMQHFKEFGEILNLDDVVKTSAENGGINIHLAYDKFVQPKREELNQAKVKELVEKAREEGKAEALKNIQIPTAGAPLNQNSQLDALLKKPEERAGYGSMAAINAWKENRAKGGIINSVL